MDFLNGYLEYLNEMEIRGPNLPVERDEKPNYIRQCMMQEDDRVKIRCLRKLKEMTAMNPFYQYRIDRFIDAITGTYERTEEPGFNEYKLEESKTPLNELFGKTNYLKKVEKELKPLSKIYRNNLGKCEEINKDEIKKYFCYIKTAQKYINLLKSSINKLNRMCDNEKDKQSCISAVNYNINSKIDSEQHEVKLWKKAIQEIKAEKRG